MCAPSSELALWNRCWRSCCFDSSYLKPLVKLLGGIFFIFCSCCCTQSNNVENDTVFDDRLGYWKLVQSSWQCFVSLMVQEVHDLMAKRRRSWLQWLWVDKVGVIQPLQNFISFMLRIKLEGSMSRKTRDMDRKMRDIWYIYFSVTAQELKIAVL